MTIETPSWSRGKWNVLSQWALKPLVEPIPTAGEHAVPVIQTSRRRLSRSGQISLGLALSILAGLLYKQTFASNQRLSQQFQLCLPLHSARMDQTETGQQTQSLINNLTHATPSQKLRLRQQYTLLLSQSARLCGVASLYRSQESALMTVATSALCLLSLTLTLGISHGLVNNNNRTLNALQITAAFLLVVPMLFLQLGEQVRNTPIYYQLYQAHRDLIQQLQSALANQDLPPLRPAHTESEQTARNVVPGLTDSTRVAQLIRRIDRQLQALPPIPLNFNDSTVIHVYSWLSTSWKEAISK